MTIRAAAKTLDRVIESAPPQLIVDICDHLPVAVWVARAPGGEFVYANRLFDEIMGTGPVADAAVGGYSGPYGIRNQAGEPYPEDRLPFVRALRARTTVVVDDIVIHRPDGRRVNVAAHARPLLDAEGEVTYVVIAFVDTTATAAAQREHLAAEARYRALAEEQQFLIEHMGDFVYRHDTDGVFYYLSPAVETVTGYTVDEWKHHYTRYLTGIPDNQRVIELTERALRTGEKQTPYRVEIRHKDGHPITLEINEQPFRAGDRVAGLVGVARDVTERTRHEEEIERLNASLREQTEELERIIHVASHDLRTPLVGIEGFAVQLGEALEQLDETEPEGRRALSAEMGDMVRRIESGVRRLDTLLGGLLRLSRLGRGDIRREPVDMNALLGCVAESIAFQLRAAGARLEIDDLHPCRGDAFHLEQVFSNLLDNAVKYLSRDRPGRIHVTCTQMPGRLEYRVIDNGIGIEETMRGRIFDAFYRLDPRQTRGEGLGLSIAQRIVRRHGGDLQVEPTEGGGTTFVVSLPA